jgi:hypothetical protein
MKIARKVFWVFVKYFIFVALWSLVGVYIVERNNLSQAYSMAAGGIFVIIWETFENAFRHE